MRRSPLPSSASTRSSLTLPLLAKLVGPGLRLSADLYAPRARVVIDGTQLRQVLLNLVGNAADATRGHGSQVRVSTHLVVLEADQARARGLIAEGTFLVLSVSDDGPGMTPGLLERAFDPFFTTKSKGEGTGLGLAMTSSIVRRAGGFIAVETAPDEGATFRVHLPVASLPAATEQAAAPPQRQARDGQVVLVVDDNEALRNLVTRVLADHGLRVLEAPDLAQARGGGRGARRRPAHRRRPAGRRRQALIDEAVAHRWARHVILMSGAELADLDGGVQVVAKPFHLESLVDTVLRTLGEEHPSAPAPAGP